MNKQYYIISAIVGMAAVGAFVFTYAPDGCSDVESQDFIYNYDARKNLDVGGGGGGASWRTTSVSDIADAVLYTIRGTVLSVGEPLHWIPRGNAHHGNAAFPVILSVDEIYKGTWNCKIFTVVSHVWYYTLDDNGDFVYAFKNATASLYDPNKVYLTLPENAQYEIGEEIIVHISAVPVYDYTFYAVDDITRVEQFIPFYSSVLGEHSKYTIKNNTVYDNHRDTSISMDIVINESQ